MSELTPANGEPKPELKRALVAQVFLDDSGQITLSINQGITDKVKFCLTLAELALSGVEKNVAIERKARQQIAIPRLATPRNMKRA